MKELLLLLAAITLLLYAVYRIGKWQMKRDAKIEAIYNTMYKNIEDSINILTVNATNYEAINDQIITLISLKHQNREKTEVLYLKFLRKFAVKRKEEVNIIDETFANGVRFKVGFEIKPGQTPDLCCGIYEDPIDKRVDKILLKPTLKSKLNRIEEERRIRNRSDVTEVDMEFMNTIH